MTDEQKRIAKLQNDLQVYMEGCQLLMAELVKRNIPVPDKPGKEKAK